MHLCCTVNVISKHFGCPFWLRSTSTSSIVDMADLKEAIAFTNAKLNELVSIRKEISCVLKAVGKLERDSAEKGKKLRQQSHAWITLIGMTDILANCFIRWLLVVADKLEQYARRLSEDIDAIVIAMVQQKLGQLEII